MKEQVTLADVLRKIEPRQARFVKTDIREIVNPFDYIKPYIPDNYDELTYEETEKLNIPSYEDLNIYRLPSYEEINNYEIMRFFTKECVEEKEARQALFYSLRNDIYVEKFYNTLKKYKLYEEFLDFSEDYYNSIIMEWMEKNNIKFD